MEAIYIACEVIVSDTLLSSTSMFQGQGSVYPERNEIESSRPRQGIVLPHLKAIWSTHAHIPRDTQTQPYHRLPHHNIPRETHCFYLLTKF